MHSARKFRRHSIQREAGKGLQGASTKMMSNLTQVSQPASRSLGGLLAALRPAERMLAGLVVAVGLAAVALAFALQRNVNWLGFAPGIAAAFGMMAVGAYARGAAKALRLGAAAIGIGIFMGFTALAAILIFSLFPLTNPVIDLQLKAWDAALGYEWTAFVAALAEWPMLGAALGYLYHSSLPQMIAVIILLAALGREREMQRFLLVGMLCMAVTVGFWWLWPSVGPSAYADIPKGIADRIGLVVTPAVGEHLRMLVETGPQTIGPETVMGVVAFPSYHMIMALMVAWFARATLAAWPAALAGLGMVPATLSHGGHHLVDLFAATLVFGLCVWLAKRALPDQP